MIISLIVAHDKKHGIGMKNALPWTGKIPRDMARFKELTTGKPVIMGRKTFESIGKPLPNRTNIILTRDRTWRAAGVWRAHTLSEALAIAGKESEEVFVIGGAELFHQALPLAARMYITEIDGTFDCDVFFPKYDPLLWKQSSLVVHHADDRNTFKLKFLNLERKTAP